MYSLNLDENIHAFMEEYHATDCLQNRSYMVEYYQML